MNRNRNKKRVRTVCLILAFLLLIGAGVVVGVHEIRKESAYTQRSKTMAADSAQQIAETIVKDLSLEKIIELEPEQISKFYRLSETILENSAVYKSSSATSADEIAVFRVETDLEMQSVGEAIQKRIEECKIAYASLSPEEREKVDNCLEISSGKYIVFVMCDDMESIAGTLDKFYE